MAGLGQYSKEDGVIAQILEKQGVSYNRDPANTVGDPTLQDKHAAGRQDLGKGRVRQLVRPNPEPLQRE